MLKILATYRRGRTVQLRGKPFTPEYRGTIEGTALGMESTPRSKRIVLRVKVKMPYGTYIYPHHMLDVEG